MVSIESQIKAAIEAWEADKSAIYNLLRTQQELIETQQKRIDSLQSALESALSNTPKR